MSEDTRLYSARPILISADCKRESGQEHTKNVLDPVMRALDSKKDLTRLRTNCLASDGETRRGTAFIIKTFKHKLPSTSNIYPLLKDLKFMNFMVGEDDFTGDKDPKHVDKRLRNGVLRERGIKIRGIHLTPDIIRAHFQSTGHTVDHTVPFCRGATVTVTVGSVALPFSWPVTVTVRSVALKKTLHRVIHQKKGTKILICSSVDL